MRLSGIGGQAVIEGVMMKNKNDYAIAVRKPDNEIIVEKKTQKSVRDKYKFLNWPILRGVVTFVESMVVGMKTITFSASFFEEEEDAEPTKVERAMGKVFKGKTESIIMGFTVVVALLLAVGIFMILPYFISGFFKTAVSPVWQAVIEGAIRMVIFIGYVAAISLMKDIRRVFMYHGAEHKTINCLENGYELNVKNVRKQTKVHKRCGTSFLLYVIIISIIFFSFIRVEEGWLRILIRIILIPVIAGIAYEFIRLAGSSNNVVIGILSKPGLWLQGLTTREPDDGMIEVAIKSVEGVFNWKDFLKGGSGKMDGSAMREPEQENVIAIKTLQEKKERKSVETTPGILKKSSVRELKKADKNSGKDVKAVSAADEENEYSAAIKSRPGSPVSSTFDDEVTEEEEDDEVLKALDKYFVFDENDEK